MGSGKAADTCKQSQYVFLGLHTGPGCILAPSATSVVQGPQEEACSQQDPFDHPFAWDGSERMCVRQTHSTLNAERLHPLRQLHR